MPAVAIGPLALLFLATVLMMLRPTNASSSSSSWSIHNGCGAVYDACIEDGDIVCSECITAYDFVDTGTQVQCLDDYYANYPEPCSRFTQLPCCYDSYAPHDCLSNSGFIEFFECTANKNYQSCIDAPWYCREGAEGTASGVVAGSSPSIMLAVFLGVAIMTAASFLAVSP